MKVWPAATARFVLAHWSNAAGGGAAAAAKLPGGLAEAAIVWLLAGVLVSWSVRARSRAGAAAILLAFVAADLGANRFRFVTTGSEKDVYSPPRSAAVIRAVDEGSRYGFLPIEDYFRGSTDREGLTTDVAAMFGIFYSVQPGLRRFGSLPGGSRPSRDLSGIGPLEGPAAIPRRFRGPVGARREGKDAQRLRARRTRRRRAVGGHESRSAADVPDGEDRPRGAGSLGSLCGGQFRRRRPHPGDGDRDGPFKHQLPVRRGMPGPPVGRRRRGIRNRNFGPGAPRLRARAGSPTAPRPWTAFRRKSIPRTSAGAPWPFLQAGIACSSKRSSRGKRPVPCFPSAVS